MPSSSGWTMTRNFTHVLLGAQDSGARIARLVGTSRSALPWSSRCPTDQALSCRPPVTVPRLIRRAPAEPTPNRAAAGWQPRQADQAAAGQLQCLVRPHGVQPVRDPARKRGAERPTTHGRAPEWTTRGPQARCSRMPGGDDDPKEGPRHRAPPRQGSQS
jgi:hypothetical protein